MEHPASGADAVVRRPGTLARDHDLAFMVGMLFDKACPTPVRMQVTKCLYFLVLTVCAPVWEEVSSLGKRPKTPFAVLTSWSPQCCANLQSCPQVIFRGFLMPSLTRYMPLWTAVVSSALIFAVVHFSFQRFLVLVLLGFVFGALYAESNNLLAAITAHSLWNMWVFLQFVMQAHPGLPL